MSYQPHEIARIDQHIARSAEALDQLVASYRSKREAASRIEVLDFAIHSLACPHMDDGTQTCPVAHIFTLANMLAIAIDRLAQVPSA